MPRPSDPGLPELSEQDRNWYILKGYEIEESIVAVSRILLRQFKLHGKLHREDGPALENSLGYKSYYIHGILIPRQTYQAALAELNNNAT